MITIVGRGKNSLFHFKKQNVTLAFFVWKDFLLFILWRICNQCCPPTHVGFLVARILSGLFCFFFSRFSGPKRDEERQTRATGKGQAHLLFFSRGTTFFHSKNLPSCWGLIFAIFRRSCPRNTSETTRRDVTVCKTRCRLTTIACFVWRNGRRCHA